MFGSGELPNYYQVLGVPEDADQEAIEAAFLGLVREYHPDTSREPDPGSRRFKELCEAYRVLSDPVARRDYDRRRGRRIPVRVEPSRYSQGPTTSSTTSWSVPPSMDIWGELPITPEEATWGGRCQLKVRREVDCPACRPGDLPTPQHNCSKCHATGRCWEVVDVRFRIPAGARTGTLIALAGYGHQQPGRPWFGRLLLRVRVRPSW
ncbi:MAG: hypothetical protein KatS3mg110_2231 [Pirellulaceae bacterium]|nr:MAG: hypothetical protein KatS3mg110_2231 [Pirellulaceae bacterium]